MKRVVLVTAAFAAAVAVLTLLSLPPARVSLETAWRDGTIAGLLHVHTNRSDGRSSPDEIAAAAASAGLQFVVFTDHGDATRAPDPPTYRSGVLCLDGVEISTSGGHYIGIGMAEVPYPLAGEARDVVEDVRRLGGFGIAAHPDSPKVELQWTDWSAHPDALEIVNPDTGWRVHFYEGGWQSRFRLLRSLVAYPWRSSETIGQLLTRSDAAIREWDTATRARHMVGLAGADAHAKLPLVAADPGDNRFSLPLPGYEASFGTLSVHAFLDSPLGGDAAADGERLLGALRRGRLYVAIDAWAAPPALTFTAANRTGTASMGEDLAADGPLRVSVRTNAPDGFVTTLLRNGQAVGTPHREREFMVEGADAEGIYRLEIHPSDSTRSPWILSNPIYVRPGGFVAPADGPSASARPALSAPLFDGRSTTGWTGEFDATSLVALEVSSSLTGPELRIRYGLSGGVDVGQFAGAAVDTPAGVGSYDAVAFGVRAETPMRISVQTRAHVDGAPPERWRRSVYVDDTERPLVVPFADMTPVGETHTPRAPAQNVRNVMFIVDTLNSVPGASGRVWLKNIRLEKYGTTPATPATPGPVRR